MAAECLRLVESLRASEHPYEDMARLISEQLRADVYVARVEDERLFTAERYRLHAGENDKQY